jgi:hypothetical protein
MLCTTKHAPHLCNSWNEGLLCVPVQSAFDQGRLANLTSFVNNAVLFTVAATHVVELTRSAVSGNAGIHAALISCCLTPLSISVLLQVLNITSAPGSCLV